MLRAVGVLPAFTQREAEVADEFLVKGDGYVETVAGGPVLGTFLGIADIGITVEYLIIGGIEIGYPLIVIIEECVSG